MDVDEDLERAPEGQRGRPSTRDQIPVVALRLFGAKGYEATSMREIAEQLGITKAALYYHFNSKEDIVRAVLAAMVSQLDDLVQWAKAQPPGPELRREVLLRWAAIMHAHGLTMFRFLVGHGEVLRGAGHDRAGMTEKLGELIALMVPPGASVQDQLRVRIALMSINMAGIAGVTIDATDEEILVAARRIATELLPHEDRPDMGARTEPVDRPAGR